MGCFETTRCQLSRCTDNFLEANSIPHVFNYVQDCLEEWDLHWDSAMDELQARNLGK